MRYKATQEEMTQAFRILHDLATNQTKRDHRDIDYKQYREVLDSRLEQAQELINGATERIIKDLTCQPKIQKPSKKR